MNKTIAEILEAIESNGFEAYIVGGYVRDFIIGIDSTDIDICTNAKVVDLLKILEKYQPTSGSYGAVKFTYNNYKVDITTYRKDLKYNGARNNLEVEYVNNLLDDLKRRDFTCNTICMNRNGEIIDLLDGCKDIEQKLVRCVGNVEKKISEDPLRILRAIRLATCLNFKIEPTLYENIKKYRESIADLSTNRIKEELSKILTSKNFYKGLDFFKRLGMTEYLGLSYDKIQYVPDICGMYSQIELTREFPFTKKELENINSIKKIIKYGKIDKEILFTYGLYISLVAGELLGFTKEEITELDKKMSIKTIKDIAISSDEICEILSIEPSKAIGEVYSVLKSMILDEELENDNEVIKQHLETKGKKWLNEGEFKKGFTF